MASGGSELTGNHYLSVPRIEHDDAAIPTLTALHSALAGLLAWSGDPLLRPRFRSEGSDLALGGARWERIDRWIPRVRARLGEELELTLTLCAPAGYDPLVRGACIEIEVRNAGSRDRQLEIGLDVSWRETLLHVRTGRPLAAADRLVTSGAEPGLALEVGAVPFAAALALLPGGDASAAFLHVGGERRDIGRLALEHVRAPGAAIRAELVQSLTIGARRSARTAFFLGLGRDRDSAFATAAHLRRLGTETLLREGRFALSQLARKADDPGVNELLNRNLLFNHFFAVGRGLDDDRLHAVASRSPLHGTTAIYSERDALAWTLPALTLNDPLLGRELLLRAFEAFSGAPGQPERYIDGGILAPGRVLDQLLLYPLALDRFVRESDDTSLLDEPLVQDVLREIDGALYDSLHRDVLLARTELLASGDIADFPYPTIGNVLLWAYCGALPRIWRGLEGEPPPAFADAAEEVAAAIWQRCTVPVDGLPVLVSSTNLQGDAAVYDDPAFSLVMLPSLQFCERDDPIWRNTMELLRSPAYPLWRATAAFPGLGARTTPGSGSVAALCCELLGPGRDAALRTLRALQLTDGVAAERYDFEDGSTSGGAHAAALAGFLAWALDRGAPPRARGRRRRA
ncbi:MAG TPA: glycoside hydrolase family 125 protein [Longimicrobiales bacterium]|nr:glycoside hydrolase family 125 protein [Longimicrobiales bacterium]